MSAGLALAARPGLIGQPADPGEFVVRACERAKALLHEALERGGIEQIAELRSQAEAVRVYTAQKQLGKDAQLAAAEVVRRAERGIGLAIRRGQAAGEITRRGGHGGNQHRRAEPVDNGFCTTRPTDYASPDELTGNGAGIYHLADGVSDAEFEESLAEARAEENLSRANVIRKIRDKHTQERRQAGEQDPAPDRSPTAAQARRELIARNAAAGLSSRQIADQIGISDRRVREIAHEHGIDIRADAVVGRTRRHDSVRIVRETANALEGLVMGIELADPAQLNPADAVVWASIIARSARVLGRFARQIKEVTQ